ncbi:uncharacterized protein LOC126906095 isoform X3 [Daktulosphaira vitifoliae]|uniref:uncharacterized protein LOC126906095 isoform X3 n=1 Tax=Daktulosphaira vitifoliae TaxID=58002 RepID=UPI0021AAA096|nr:uncharacterized protein LOC126906095 isoform X3 [Daktulosphaira vitifoliae]
MGFYFYFGILLYFVCVIIKHTFSAGTSNVEEKELFKGLTQADIKYISCNIKLSNIKENVNQYLIEQYELDDTEVIRFTVDQVTYCTKIIIENDVDKDGFLTIDELTTVLCKFIDGKIVKVIGTFETYFQKRHLLCYMLTIFEYLLPEQPII